MLFGVLWLTILWHLHNCCETNGNEKLDNDTFCYHLVSQSTTTGSLPTIESVKCPLFQTGDLKQQFPSLLLQFEVFTWTCMEWSFLNATMTDSLKGDLLSQWCCLLRPVNDMHWLRDSAVLTSSPE